MTDETMTTNTESEVDYIAAIQELQENTVSKQQYEKLKEEKNKLLNALVKGEKIEQPAEKKVDITALRKKLFDRDSQMSNLEYVQTSLELRDALLAEGEADPFLPVGSQIAPTPDEAVQAEKVAQIYRECIDYAQGNSEVFTNELMRRTVDAMPSKAKRSR